jgi:hypothetical protein
VTGADQHERPGIDGADRVGQLVRLAGRRPMPDPAHMARARTAAHEEWRRLVRRRTWRTSLWGVTAAVLALATVGALVWRQRPAPAAPAVAVEIGVVEAVKGTVTVTRANGVSQAVVRGARLRAGDRIETGADGRTVMSMGGTSVRLDRGSAAGLGGAAVALTRGAVYVDTGAARSDAKAAHSQSSLRVPTPLGTVHHVGTQFEVRLTGRDPGADELRVSVREGAVILDRAGDRWTSRAGERLLVRAGRSVERQSLAPSAPDWAWIQDVPRPFRLEGATVPQFLDWASRELGARWEYGRPDMQRRVDRVVLHGSLEDLTPDEALAAVLPTCGLRVTRFSDQLLVFDAR